MKIYLHLSTEFMRAQIKYILAYSYKQQLKGLGLCSINIKKKHTGNKQGTSIIKKSNNFHGCHLNFITIIQQSIIMLSIPTLATSLRIGTTSSKEGLSDGLPAQHLGAKK